MEEIGDGEDSAASPPGAPGRHVAGESPETRRAAGQATHTGKGYAEPGERTRPDHGGKQIDVGDPERRVLEELLDCGQKPLGMSPIGFESAGLEDGLSASERDTAEGRRGIHGQNETVLSRHFDGRH